MKVFKDHTQQNSLENSSSHDMTNGSKSWTETSREPPAKNQINHSPERPIQGHKSQMPNDGTFQKDRSDDDLVFTVLPPTMKKREFNDRANPDNMVTPPTTELPRNPDQLERALWSRIMTDEDSQLLVTGMPPTENQIASMMASESFILNDDAPIRDKREATDDTEAIEYGSTHLQLPYLSYSMMRLQTKS
ncbi:uncharacterized protein LOC121370793 isoform X2 [Gigantopelta aegis]|uniref:uncharacterized protein LOC121370793 isoform X2 n=1 Tax=Gigantopelta aegis TaxID=1735272 RepID=UPI001B88C4B5|nr:uncharacterized protein LOC121370793 isoform X2 [Gigantopelta aegis]